MIGRTDPNRSGVSETSVLSTAAAAVDHLEGEQLMLKYEKSNRPDVTNAIPQHNTFPWRVCNAGTNQVDVDHPSTVIH